MTRELQDLNDSAVSHTMVTVINGRFRTLNEVTYIWGENNLLNLIFWVPFKLLDLVI